MTASAAGPAAAAAAPASAPAGDRALAALLRRVRAATGWPSASLQLVEHLPAGLGRVAESGLRTAQDIITLRRAGFEGFLIGETFMRHGRPERACAALVQQLRDLTSVPA